MQVKSLLLLVVIFCIITLSCDKSREKLAIINTKKSIDLGDISILDTIGRTLFLKNISSKKLKIDSVATSCGCTVVSLNKSSVSKSDSLAIKIKFVPDEIGKFKEMIVIDANTDPPFTIVEIIGEVK